MSEPVGYRIEIAEDYRDDISMIVREIRKSLFSLEEYKGKLIIEMVVGEDDEV